MKKFVKKVLGQKLVNFINSVYPINLSKIVQLVIRHKFYKFGRRSVILYPSIFENKNKIAIGSDTAIGAFVHIWGGGGVSIGDRVLIASHVTITSLTHDHTYEEIRFAPIISKEVKISDDVWIGSHAVILPGVEIGKGAVIGAGAVVSKNIPAMAIALGVPARVVKFRHD